jgi:hypothetical protein
MSYSLRTMLIAAAVVAIVLTCLIYPDPIVDELYFTAGFLLFAFGTIAAIYSHGNRRAFLIGFLILFGSYCWYSLWSTTGRTVSGAVQPGMGVGMGTRYLPPGPITTRLLYFAYEGLNPDIFSGRQPITGRPSAPRTGEQIYGRFIGFMTIGHTLFGLALGVGGGLIARRLARQPVPTSAHSIDEIMPAMDVK